MGTGHFRTWCVFEPPGHADCPWLRGSSAQDELVEECRTGRLRSVLFAALSVALCDTSVRCDILCPPSAQGRDCRIHAQTGRGGGKR